VLECLVAHTPPPPWPHAVKKQRKLEAVKGLGGSSGVTNGMASSLVFTPTQGLELHNPAAADERKRRVEEANRK
jgi:hypothetical protein